MNVSMPTKQIKQAPRVVRNQPGGIKYWAAFAAALFVFELGALALVEGALYFAGIGEEEISLWDPQVGFSHRRNKRVTWRREGYAQSYLGPDGLREPGVSMQKTPGVYRIAVMGDSMAEGLQEPLENTFGKLLEQRLNQEQQRPVEVINFGIFGYSTVQEYLFLSRQVLKYKPDMVLLCYNTRDMAETLETWAPKGSEPVGLRPYAIKEDNKPLEISSRPIDNESKRPWSKFFQNLDGLKQYSRICGFLSQNKPKLALHNPLVEGIAALVKDPSKGLTAFVDPGADGQSFKIKFFEDDGSAPKLKETPKAAAASPAVNPNSPQRQNYLKILDQTFAALLERMNRECNEQGAKLVIAALPARSELAPIPGTTPALFDVSYSDELYFVSKNCRQQGIDFIDCHTAAMTHDRSEVEKLFYVLHFTKDGHRFVSDLLFPRLEEHVLGAGSASTNR